MTRKGLRSFFSPDNSRSHHHSHRPSSASGEASSSYSGEQVSKLEEQVARAESIIVRWDPDSSDYARVTSLFYEDRIEARRYLAQVGHLQRAMLTFASSEGDPSRLSHPCLARAQTLMKAAIRRLEKEFYQILSANRDLLDPESVSLRSARSSVSEESDFDPWEVPSSPEADEALSAGASIGELERAAAVATTDLRAIADAMIFAGYGKECLRIYRTLRKSIVDEGLFRLGFDRLAQAQKKDWAVLDLKAQSWIGAARVAVRTLFHGERVLVDHVFPGSDAVREVVFANVAAEAAVQFLAFPEAVARSKRAPEKLFRLLDMYDTLAEILPEIELVFSFESTASVRSQALASLAKLADAARAALSEFESAMLKESSRAPVPGGAVHPMTRYAMNYITLLAAYEATLEEIFADFPLQDPSNSIPTSALPATFPSEVGKRIAWLILKLILKLQAKAEAYRDAGLSYLFLANNLQYIVNKVRSCELGVMVGEEWLAEHAAKARQYAEGYERAAWARVAAAVPAGKMTAKEAMEQMRAFGAALDAACAAQAGWVVEDDAMREEVRATVRDMILPAYRTFHARWQAALGDSAAAILSPDVVRDRLGELFFSNPTGSEGSGSGSRASKSTPKRVIEKIIG